VGNEGRNLWNELWKKEILNERTEDDWEGEFTYVGARSNSVIDYVMINEKVSRKIKRFRIGDRVDSDYLPLEVVLEERKRRGQEETQENEMEEEGIEIIM